MGKRRQKPEQATIRQRQPTPFHPGLGLVPGALYVAIHNKLKELLVRTWALPTRKRRL